MTTRKLTSGVAHVAQTSRDCERDRRRKQATPASIKRKPAKPAKPTEEPIWKPTAIPDGFILVIDTSEQRPLFIERQQDLVVKHQKLVTGDYSIAGFENSVCVERKMLSDFDSFIGRERIAKTIPKLERMRSMVWSALVIECSERKLFGKRKYGKLTGEHSRGFLKKCRVQYGIHVFISDKRAELERFILDHLCYVYGGLVK